MKEHSEHRLWTVKELAEAAGVSKPTIWRIVRLHAKRLRPPSLARRGSHPRQHRIFAEDEAKLILGLVRRRKRCWPSEHRKIPPV